MSYGARRRLQCSACMLYATGYMLHAWHATCSVQLAAWLHACWRPGPALRASAVVPGSVPLAMPDSVPFSVTCHRQGACKPSRSMFALRARARRARGVPQRFRASKGCLLAAGAGEGGEGGDETPKGPSVLGCRASCRVHAHAARRAATSDATRRRQRARTGAAATPPRPAPAHDWYSGMTLQRTQLSLIGARC
jgi:hypothetical protein